MSEFKELVANLGPSGAPAEFVEANITWVENSARAIGVTARFITSRTLLLLPRHSEEEISTQGAEVIEDLEPKVAKLGEDFKIAYDALKVRAEMGLVTSDAKLKGRKQLHAQDGFVKIPVFFDDVSTETARIIQNRLHYIGSSREDNVLDCGLYLDEAAAPYAYTSFSRCDRGYQVDALNRAAGLNLEPNTVLSMTRAFAFDGTPANSMSKLFHLAHDQAKKRFPDCRAIVTALNPYLRFGGGIFTGSSYTPYALAPMEYWYDDNGFYVPRSKGKHPQQLETPPIIWLAHGLDASTSNKIESLEIDTMVHISREEYRNG